MTAGLLTGLRILDLSVWRPGPYATQLLAEIGADVIKVEPPGGDPMRAYPELFTSLSANKRSIVLDLKNETDRERALELATSADVIVEGFRPGVVGRLGVGYDVVRPSNLSVIYCSVSGMGQRGPLALVPGHDANYQAWAGALSPEGGPPIVAPLPIADLAGGLAAAFAICAAAFRRERSGEGEYIDVSMSDVLATWTGAATSRAEGVDPSARGVPGYGLFEAADGRHLVLGIISENHFWAALCAVLGLEDAGALEFVDRMARLEELQARVTAAIAQRPRDDLVDALRARDVPVAPVLDRGGMLGLSHFRERAVSTSDPWADPAIGYPVQFDAHPARRVTPPPGIDEHRGASFRDVEVRPLTGDDAEAAERVIDAALGSRHQARLGEILDVLACPGFGAWAGQVLVGVATYTGSELAALGVSVEHRGTGVGGLLVEAVASALAAAGEPSVWLVTTNDNLDALRLYQRHRFRITEVHRGGVDEARPLKPVIPLVGKHGIELHDELVLTRELTP